MTLNMDLLFNLVATEMSTIFKDGDLPSVSDIHASAERVRTICPVSEDEFIEIKKRLEERILHRIGEAIALVGADSDHQSWYFVQQNTRDFWNRYKDYLTRCKHWGLEIVRRLDKTSDDIMDRLGNPNDVKHPFQRRGLLMGDVQSGKTATYTAICNKAADAGYRVLIVLTGTTENLRVQTQGRLDQEFVGFSSRHILDKNSKIKKELVGVGVSGSTAKDLQNQVALFTSVATDFRVQTLRSLNLSLKNFNGTALFVVKKNKSVLDALYKWLVSNNTNQSSNLIDLPLLLIDDEADNASVNTNSEDKNPTAINAAIRQILRCFTRASYLGITATPFANIFIEPDVDDASRDLFPKDFLFVLPSPSHYIGSDKLFGNAIDDFECDDKLDRVNAVYSSSIVPIDNEEMKDFFPYKHKKELADTLKSLPQSLYEAIRYFMLVTAVSDYRQDSNEHRSMLVNVSRFTAVQNKTADLIADIVDEYKADLDNYALLTTEESSEIPTIKAFYDTWQRFNLGHYSNLTWEEMLQNHLPKAARRVEIRSVNQEKKRSSLNYDEYRKVGMRVIAVGGNSLSRGLTLEGLCVSYFYRNTVMYDTLLQMGRWFGYRFNYDDIFRVWMGQDSIDSYSYITDAVNELKSDLKEMERLKQTPSEFGLKVRQAPGSLQITARNKMRTGTLIRRPITVSGRMIETPRLKADLESIQHNELLCNDFFKSLEENTTEGEDSNVYYDEYARAWIWKRVPKQKIIKLVNEFESHPWGLNFQAKA
jgi:hypothetical protein